MHRQSSQGGEEVKLTVTLFLVSLNVIICLVIAYTTKISLAKSKISDSRGTSGNKTIRVTMVSPFLTNTLSRVIHLTLGRREKRTEETRTGKETALLVFDNKASNWVIQWPGKGGSGFGLCG